MAGIRETIVQQAKSWDKKIQYAGNYSMIGADELVEMYKTCGPGGKSVLFGGAFSPLVEKGVRNGMWIRKVPLAPPPPPARDVQSVDKYCTAKEEGEHEHGPFAWCGVFATFVLKKSGLAAYWAHQMINCDKYVRWGNGIKGSPSDWKSKIEPGDICCLDTKPGANNNHHIIIVGVTDGSDALDSVEGNLSVPRQSVQWMKGKRNRTDIYTLYKLQADSMPAPATT